MRERFQWPAPMLRVQYQLLGGSRRMSAVLAICAVLLIVGTVAIRRFFPRNPFPTVAGWVLNFLVGVQVLTVVLGGCNAIYRAMLRDYETRMIESHRLTPMSSIAVSLGYLFGSTLQVGTLFVLFAAFGAALSLVAGLPVLTWLLGNLILLIGAIPLWAAAVFAGMRPEKPFNPAPVIVAIGALTVPISIVPGLALLFNTYTVLMAIRMLTSAGKVVTAAVVIPTAVSLLFTVFWLLVAAVKYRRPDLPAFNALRGLFFLVVTMLIGTGGIVAFDRVTRTGMPQLYDPDFQQGQWSATMVGGLVLGGIAVAGAVNCRMRVSRGAAPRDWSDRVSDLLVAVLATLLICSVMAFAGAPIWRRLLLEPSGEAGSIEVMIHAWSYSALACLLALLSVRSVFELAHARAKSANVIAGLFVMLAWGGPPLVDVFRAEYMREFRQSAMYSDLLGCSPVGTLVATWYRLDVGLVPGLVVQFAVAVVLIFLARRFRQRAGGPA